MKRALFAAALTGFSLSAFAAETFSSSPAWDYLEAGYQQADVDDIDELDPKGYALEASKAVGENFFINASFRDLSDDEYGIDVDLEQLSLGLGYHYGLTKSTDLFGVLSYERLEGKVRGRGTSFSDDDSGFGVTVGIRSMIIDQLELTVAAKHIELDGGDTGVEGGINFYLTPQFVLGASYELREDFSIASANLRYNF